MSEHKPEVLGTVTVGGRDYVKVHQGKKVRQHFTGRFDQAGAPVYQYIRGGVTYFRVDKLLAGKS